MKIVIAGGTGQIGTVLARHFSARKIDTVVLTRRRQNRGTWRELEWDGRTEGLWCAELRGADGVINLTGSTINTRYTEKNRNLILNSRLESTRVLAEAIRNTPGPPKVWLNASATGIYPHSTTRSFDESTQEFGDIDTSTPETWRFAANVCRQWEDTFFAADAGPVRKVALRTSLLLSPDKGGVFDTLMKLVSKGLGGRQGNGRQCVSWMHEADYIRAIDMLIQDDSISGPVNLCAPQAVSNAAFMRELRHAAGVPFGIPAPEFGVKLAAMLLLRTEPWLVLKSVNTKPAALMQAGFDFQYADFGAAARNLVRRWKQLQ